jgi:multiple sugar transport system ATP-binding protein
MSQLAFHALDVRYDDLRALREVSAQVQAGEFFCVVGPTNAGKSTLLKTIAGLIRPESGSVSIRDRDVTRSQPKDRNVSLLFQNMALFPNLSGFDNIAFPLRTAGMAEAEVQGRVRELAELLRISHVLGRLPRTFSGGEQQRVAIGRAMARPADVLMLDEPLTNLDARLRIALRIEFKQIHRSLGRTIVYVTHDQVEAMSLSDRVAILHEGQFQQIGSPDDVYHRPGNRFVAEFIGQSPMSFVAATLEDVGDVPGIRIGARRYPMPDLRRLEAYGRTPAEVACGIRAEAIRVGPVASEATPHEAKVLWVERLGSHCILDLAFGATTLKARVPPDGPFADGEGVWFGFEPRPDHLLDPGSDCFLR